MPWAVGIFDPAGPAAREIDDLWWLLLVLGVAVFVLFSTLLVLALRRARGDGHAGEADPAGDERALHIGPWVLGGGVILPAVTIVVVLVATVASMRTVGEEPPAGALVVEVTGHQWWWEVQYPDLEIETANEIHIPAGRPVELRLSSADVVHSFWVPDLAGKMDLLPEDVNTLVIRADRPGRYDGRCAEFCGLQHARMSVFVVADTPDDFDAWVERNRATAAEATTDAQRRGRELLVEQACADCHTVRGTDAAGDRGPDLTHLAGRRTIAAGTLRLTPDSLRDWIEDPHDSKNGVLMPAAELEGSQIDDLVAYLESLR